MPARARLVASLTRRPEPAELEALSSAADLLEVRADRTGDLEPAELRKHFDGELLYTLRSRSEGGVGPEGGKSRQGRLRRAATGYDLVDLEARRDLEPELLEAVPAGKRLLSWHGQAGSLEELNRRFDRMSKTEAALYKLVPRSERASDGLRPLALLRSLGRDDVVAFASGREGLWTRLLAPRLGAAIVYGAAGEPPAAPGQPALEVLRRVYGLPELPDLEALFGLVGHPVIESLSPLLHNGCYRKQGLPLLYLPFEVERFGDFWLDLVESGSLEVLGFRLVGLSVTAPFKEIALAVSGAASPLAERIGAANTLVRREQVWEAESTDPEGIARPLRARGLAVQGLEAAVLGAGGAGRAAAFALAREGARVTLVNRGVERGRRVALELGIAFLPPARFDPGAYDLLVNATPLGRHSEDELPFAPERLAAAAVVIDLAYLPGGPTRTVRETRAVGRLAIDGREVLLAQAVPQYRLMVGRDLPLEHARRLLGLGEAE